MHQLPSEAQLQKLTLDRFLRYVRIDTTSHAGTGRHPSTACQWNLLRLLESELRELGATEVELNEHGCLTATVPSNVSQKTPCVGLFAHVDTSDAVSGAGVNPQVIENYRGGDISLPGNTALTIKAGENPELLNNIGGTIVTSDGNTLLGADDKAGIAAILAVVEVLLKNPKIPHGRVRVAFTPDEEIGEGTKFFDLKKFGADFAYTIDGDAPGELNKETFSADEAEINIQGINIHPGKAKNRMVNAVRVAAALIERMPKELGPEMTAGYEGYLHPRIIEGSEERASIKVLLRDFRTAGLAELRKLLEQVIAEVQLLYPRSRIELSVREQYRNMADYIPAGNSALSFLWEAVKRSGLTPCWAPIRGGTDGSRLTELGLITPNVFTGGQNAHALTEWLAVRGMVKAAETMLHLLIGAAEERA